MREGLLWFDPDKRRPPQEKLDQAAARVLPVAAFPTAEGPNGEKIQRSKLREMAAAALS